MEVKVIKQYKSINILKVVLAEENRTNRRLAEVIGKNETSVSRRYFNKSQLGLDTLTKLAGIQDVDIRLLINKTNIG